MKVITIDDIIGYWGMEGVDIRRELEAANGEDIQVNISSPGGFVWDGLEIFNLLKNYEGHVTTHLMGLAASMASYVALAGDKITAESNSVFMIHNVSIGVNGDYRSITKAANFVEGLTKLLAKVYAKKTGKSIKEIRSLMDEESYFYGSEIKDEGFVDEVIALGKDDTRSDAVAFANLQIEECNSKMKEIEDKKNDIEKAAALLKISNDNHFESTTKAQKPTMTTGVGDNINKRRTVNMAIMTLTTCKAENPDLYNEICQVGETRERERVKAHMEWIEIAPEAVSKAILEGEDFTMAHLSAYNKAGLNKNDLDVRNDENPENVDTPKEVDGKEAEKKMLGEVLSFSKKKEV